MTEKNIEVKEDYYSHTHIADALIRPEIPLEECIKIGTMSYETIMKIKTLEISKAIQPMID